MSNKHIKAWTAAEHSKLQKLASKNIPTRLIAMKLGRTANEIYAQAYVAGVSLKPTNQSPYSRRSTKKNAGNSVTKSVESWHVTPSNKGQWAVRRSGADRATVKKASKKEAIRAGRTYAKEDRGSVYVHDRDGTILEKRTYNRDDPVRR